MTSVAEHHSGPRSSESGPRVFVSFSGKDRDIATRLMADLEARGLIILNREFAISPGESVSAHITTAIGQADAVVVLITRNAARSGWVLREISYALSLHAHLRRTVIIPVVLEPDSEVPPFLEDLQYADLSMPDRYETELDRLVAVIRQRPVESSADIGRAREQLLRAEYDLLRREALRVLRRRAERAALFSQRLAVLATLVLAVISVVLLARGFLSDFKSVSWLAPPSLGFLLGLLTGSLGAALLAPFLVRRLTGERDGNP